MALTPEQEKIARRQALLDATFAGLRENLGSDFEHLKINRIVLHDVVVSYFHDVRRHKDFHGFKLVDKIKQAVFTMKWIAKLRPVQFECPDERGTANMMYINEILAVRCGLSFMKLQPSDMPDDVYSHMLYTLHYRHMDERMLFVWLETLGHLAAAHGAGS